MTYPSKLPVKNGKDRLKTPRPTYWQDDELSKSIVLQYRRGQERYQKAMMTRHCSEADGPWTDRECGRRESSGQLRGDWSFV